MTLSTNEAACVYAALILQDEGLEITADKLTALIDAAGLEVDSIWPSIFAKALAGKDLGALLFNVGASGGAAAPAGAAGTGKAFNSFRINNELGVLLQVSILLIFPTNQNCTNFQTNFLL